MTRKLEEEFNLPHIDDLVDEVAPEVTDEVTKELQTVEDALTISEKINGALAEVRGMEAHDSEMDEIALQAVGSYEELMRLGMNMTDMAAGQVFSNAAQMLKIALEAKDSKVNRKLKQIDLMMKKARLDQQEKKDSDVEDDIRPTLDRNELLKMLGSNKDRS